MRSPARRARGIPPAASAVAFLATLACRPVASPAVERPPAVERSPDAAAPAAEPRTGTAFDFSINRVHAIVHREGRLVVSTGGSSFLKFIDGGWKNSWILGLRDQGKRVAYVAGLSASLTVPLDPDGEGDRGGPGDLSDLRLRLMLRALVPRQRVSVFVNEKPIGTVEIPATYGTHELTVPVSVLAPGENRIRLTFRSAAPIPGGRRSAAAVERIEIGAAAPAAGEAAPDDSLSGEMDLGGDRRRALFVPGPSRLSFYVQVPAGGKLAAAYGATTPGTTALVRVASDDSATATLLEGAASARWTEGSWDLSRWAERAVRIDLVSRGGAVAWAGARILAPAPAPTPSRPKIDKIDRIFVWMVDTLRADKMHVYNSQTIVQTPHYDAFAEDATRFAWAQVPGTWSLPSHASILTGVYPTVHKATAHEARLDKGVPFVAELMRKAGYRTAMFSSNGYVSAKWGFDRGWDINRNFIRENLPNGADYLWKTAKPWILANGPRPQFVYLATVEPHVIYNPKKQYLARYWKKPYHGPIKPALTGIQLGQIKTGKLKINDNDKAYLEALHNAEITESDAYFGVFIADLKTAGLYDTSAIIVISDHGDEFWEHGDVGHAQSVHQELVHVPLIIRVPGVFPAGKVVTTDVEAMDLFPTVLDLAGIATPPKTQASSLLPLLQGELGPRAAWSQNLGMSRGLKVGRYRVVHSGARIELYDEIADPLEKTDLYARSPIALRQMRNVFALLAAYENRWQKRDWGTAANVTEAFYTAVGE
jgi:arylsulfatase A-like enzyme